MAVAVSRVRTTEITLHRVIPSGARDGPRVRAREAGALEGTAAGGTHATPPHEGTVTPRCSYCTGTCTAPTRRQSTTGALHI